MGRPLDDVSHLICVVRGVGCCKSSPNVVYSTGRVERPYLSGRGPFPVIPLRFFSAPSSPGCLQRGGSSITAEIDPSASQAPCFFHSYRPVMTPSEGPQIGASCTLAARRAKSATQTSSQVWVCRPRDSIARFSASSPFLCSRKRSSRSLSLNRQA